MFLTRTRAARAAMLATIGGATLMVSAATRDVASPMYGGPWISIEAPANPYEQATRGSLMLVHTFHHGTPLDIPIVGKAEGLVDGQRRSVALTLSKSERPGTHGVRNEWGNKGVWTVLLTATPVDHGSAIQAVVEVDADGEVGRVTVPRAGNGTRLLSAAEVDRGLRARAGVPTVVGGR